MVGVVDATTDRRGERPRCGRHHHPQRLRGARVVDAGREVALGVVEPFQPAGRPDHLQPRPVAVPGGVARRVGLRQRTIGVVEGVVPRAGADVGHRPHRQVLGEEIVIRLGQRLDRRRGVPDPPEERLGLEHQVEQPVGELPGRIGGGHRRRDAAGDGLDGDRLATVDEREPDVDGESQRLLGPPRSQPVLECGRRLAVDLEPLRGRAMGVGGGERVTDRHLVAQGLGEEVVVAVPLVAPVQRHQEEPLVLGLAQQPVGIGLAGHGAGERRVDPIDDRRGVQEAAHAWSLLVDDLGDEVVGEGAQAPDDLAERGCRRCRRRA